MNGPFIQGRIIDEHLLADLFSFLHQTQRTVTLTVVDGSVRKQVHFADGSVIAAGSNAPEDGFGRVAIAMGLIQPEQIARGLQGAPPQSRIGNALLRAGAINAGELWRILKRQIEQICCSLLELNRGEFSLAATAGEQPATRTRLDTQQILLEGLRRRDELQRHPLPRELTSRYPSVATMLGTYNEAFSRIFAILGRVSHCFDDGLRLDGYFAVDRAADPGLLSGVEQTPEGRLLLERIEQNLTPTKLSTLRRTLREYLRFLLFVVREVLPPEEGESIAVEVRALLTTPGD